MPRRRRTRWGRRDGQLELSIRIFPHDEPGKVARHGSLFRGRKVKHGRTLTSHILAMDGDGEETNAASFLLGVKYEHLLAGLCGGVFSTLITHPFDLIKLRFAG